MDGPEASIVLDLSIMMTTSVHTYKESRNPSCTTGANVCTKLWAVDHEKVTFIADPENFTLMVDHSLITSSVSSSALRCFLYVGAGSAAQDELCKTQGGVDAVWGGGSTTSAPCYVTPSKAEGKDYFSIGHLLQSMDISLDGASGDDATETLRSSGLLVNMVMQYSNFHTWHLGVEREGDVPANA